MVSLSNKKSAWVSSISPIISLLFSSQVLLEPLSLKNSFRYFPNERGAQVFVDRAPSERMLGGIIDGIKNSINS